MRRKPGTRITRYLALFLELGGGVAIVYGLSRISLVAAIIVTGVLLVVAAQFPEELL